MKKLWIICILLSMMTIGYSQNCDENPGVLLGKTFKQVKRIYSNCKPFHLIDVTDSTLTFYNWQEDVTNTYTFKYYKGKRYCTISSTKVDCLSGEELIGQHLNDCSWEIVSDAEWMYYTPAYDIPLTVTLTYVDGFMLFQYRYIPDYMLTGH